jgi:hypothetical protein
MPDEMIGYFSQPNPYSVSINLGLTQPLTEMSTRELPRYVTGRRRARKASNLTVICEPIA